MLDFPEPSVIAGHVGPNEQSSDRTHLADGRSAGQAMVVFPRLTVRSNRT
jgi:hypothetical protein